MSKTARSEGLAFILHLADVLGGHALQKPGSFRQIESWIARFDAQEETVRGRVSKSFHTEDRVIGLRQFVQSEHSNHSKNRGAKHGQFKSNRNEGRPTVQRAAADIKRIGDGGNPI